VSKINDLCEEMEKANKAANYYLDELDRTPTLRNHSLAKEAVDQHRRAIEEFEAALAERRFIRSIYFISSLLAFILGVITYQYVNHAY
jgi:hypothetical protein